MGVLSAVREEVPLLLIAQHIRGPPGSYYPAFVLKLEDPPFLARGYGADLL